MHLGGRRIPGGTPYRIADLGAAHDGDLQLGYKLVETAGAAGADAVVVRRLGLSARDFKCVLGHAGHVGLAPLGAPDNEEDLALLESMDVPGLRLADVDAAAPGLLARAVEKGRPLILSFREATLDVATRIMEGARWVGSGVALLVPDPRMMEAWRAAFPACPVGLRIPTEGLGQADAKADLVETAHRLPPAHSRRNRP